jgi:hypothetical protein
MIYLFIISQLCFCVANSFQIHWLIFVSIFFLLASVSMGVILKENLSKLNSVFLNLLISLNLMCCLINLPLSPLDTGKFALILSLFYIAFILSIIILYNDIFKKNLKKKNSHFYVQYISLGLIILILKCLIPQVVRDPQIDVFTWLTEASDFFIKGGNPYLAKFSPMGSQVFGYDPGFYYFPGTLFFLMPFRYINLDIRYSLIITDLVVAFLFYLISLLNYGKRKEAISFALFIYTLPSSFSVIEKSWTEPFILLVYLVSLYLVIKSRNSFANFVLGLLLTIKQYCIFLVPFLWLHNLKNTKEKDKKWFKPLLQTSLVFLLVVAPFFYWNPYKFIDSTYTVFTQLPLRKDSLSFLPIFVDLEWISPHSFRNVNLLIFLIAFLLFCFYCLKKSPGTTKSAEIPLKLTVILFGFIFFFGTHSFLNQYYLLINLLLLSQISLQPQHPLIEC